MSPFTFSTSFNTFISTKGPSAVAAVGIPRGGWQGFDRRATFKGNLKSGCRRGHAQGRGVSTAPLVRRECFNFMPFWPHPKCVGVRGRVVMAQVWKVDNAHITQGRESGDRSSYSLKPGECYCTSSSSLLPLCCLLVSAAPHWCWLSLKHCCDMTDSTITKGWWLQMVNLYVRCY